MTTQTRPPGVAPTHPPPERSRPIGASRRAILAAGLLLLLGGVGVWSVTDLGITLTALLRGYANAVGFVQRIWPIHLPAPEVIVQQVGLTLAVVMLATLLSVVLSVPLAVWAAANTQRGAVGRMSARTTIVIARAVPDIVLAIVFVRFFGLGVLPGILAMGLHSIGMVAKLYADAIEQIDEGPREALRATGAGRGQQLLTGVLPQVLPAFVAVALHRFDINLRVSAILGYVGVAGVGLEMSQAFASLDFGGGIAWALVLVVLCVLVELLSTALRRALLRDQETFHRHNRHTLLALLRRRRSAKTARPDAPRRASVDGRGGAWSRTTPPWTPRRWLRLCYALLFAGALLWAVFSSGVMQTRMTGGWEGAARTVALFWPPTTAGAADTLLAALLVTVQIGFASTLIGAVLAIPVGSLAARNVAPNRVVHVLARGFVLAVRGLPELVIAIVFVVVVGLGPVAGALALGIGAVGLLGKLVADALEEVPPGAREALRATGASRTQVYFASTLPQAAPAMVGTTLYQLDVNVRAATLLGLVGGGGIGFYLLQATQVREYGVITLIMLLTFSVVTVLELAAILLRRLLR